MAETIKVMGTLAKLDGKFSSGIVTVSFSSDKKDETISLLFQQTCQFTMPFAPIDALTRKVKAAMLFGKRNAEFYEDEALTSGYFMNGQGLPIPKSGEIHLNYRTNGTKDMLSVAFEDKGEISISFASIQAFIKQVQEGGKDET